MAPPRSTAPRCGSDPLAAGPNVTNRVPIILLSGMAADERLFESQIAAFPELRVQPWIEPLENESLREYAARLAQVIDVRRPCILGGASFGGVVALEMSTHLPALACVLIGSIRSPSHLSWRWRMMQPVSFLGPGFLGSISAFLARSGRGILGLKTVRRLDRLSRPESRFLRWATCAIVRWRPSRASQTVRTFHIHGENDRVLPVQHVRPDVIVPGGPHALSLFRPGEVNQFLADVVERVTLDHRSTATS